MKPFIISILVFILLVSTVHAFTWDQYSGTSLWNVAVSENEQECGGSIKTGSRTVTITHDKAIATVSDWGHGSQRGAMTGNTLVIPDKTIPDSGGSSKLYNIKFTFTPDCTGFSTEYDWFYTSQYQKCHGTTTLTGKRMDETGCPAELPKSRREMLMEARAAEAKEQEQDYKEILAADPNNFWANWDMAELKKKQGNYQDYLNYVAKAASNKNIEVKTRDALKKEAANSLHLSEFPTKDKSPILRIEMDEVDSWNGGMIHNVNFRPDPVTKPSWPNIIPIVFFPNPYDIVNKVVGLPDD